MKTKSATLILCAYLMAQTAILLTNKNRCANGIEQGKKKMAINIKNIIETEDSVTVIAEDDYNGRVYSETVSHNGSSWDRNNAKDEAIRRALNH